MPWSTVMLECLAVIRAQRDWEEQTEYPDICGEPQDSDCGPHGPRRTRGKTGVSTA